MLEGNRKTVVFVIDDDEQVRRSLERLMRSAAYMTESYPSADAFLERLPYTGIGCVLLDVGMPGMKGPQLQNSLVSAGISLPVIYLTGHGDVPTGVHAMKSGAVDFLLKPADDELIVATVKAAIARHAAALELDDNHREIAARLSRLSSRERQVMEAVVSGRLNKQIAGDLGITEKTVKAHRARVMEKLETRSVAGLVRICVAAGIAPQASGLRESNRPAALRA